MDDLKTPLTDREFQLMTGMVSLAAVLVRALEKTNVGLRDRLQIEAAVEYGTLNQRGDQIAGMVLGLFQKELHHQ